MPTVLAEDIWVGDACILEAFQACHPSLNFELTDASLLSARHIFPYSIYVQHLHPRLGKVQLQPAASAVKKKPMNRLNWSKLILNLSMWDHFRLRKMIFDVCDLVQLKPRLAYKKDPKTRKRTKNDVLKVLKRLESLSLMAPVELRNEAGVGNRLSLLDWAIENVVRAGKGRSISRRPMVFR